ncbi:MAG: hypothetical protein ABUL69_03420, partial [Peristeroidobacter soli]
MVVPVAAVKVTFTPCQLALVKVTDDEPLVRAVLPELRAMATVTELLGAALRRSDEVPLAPPFNDSVAGEKLMTGVDVAIENATVAT